MKYLYLTLVYSVCYVLLNHSRRLQLININESFISQEFTDNKKSQKQKRKYKSKKYRQKRYFKEKTYSLKGPNAKDSRYSNHHKIRRMHYNC